MGLMMGATSVAAKVASGPLILNARPGVSRLLGQGERLTKIWGINGLAPGPVIQAEQGKELWMRLHNLLPQPTSLHWHGIRIDNAMDGVAGLTQEPVAQGERFDYRFTAPDAGTYWYHSHNRSWEQVARGLHGALIITEKIPPKVDQDVVMVLDDWRLDEQGQIHAESFGAIGERAHGGRLGNVMTVNGLPRQDIAVRAGERIRLRLCNVANARVFELRIERHRPYVIALDGQPVKPFELPKGRIGLGPGQRADLMIDMEGEPGMHAAIAETSSDLRLVAGAFLYHGSERAREHPLDAPIALPRNPLPTDLDMANAQEEDMVMTGGAMRFFDKAVYQGKTVDARTLVRKHGMVWALNGIAGRPEKPWFRVKRGRTVKVRMVNDTLWPHAMHFHGHHVKEIGAKNAEPLPYWRDTVLMNRGDEIEVAFIADNPGKWLMHCHMLEHQLGGMVTWYEVI